MTKARSLRGAWGALLAFLFLAPGLVGFGYAAQQQPAAQTPAQLVDQIGALLKQLQTLLAPAAPPVTTAAELTAALAKCGDVKVGPGTFTGNFTVQPCGPTTVTGSGQGVTVLAPLDKLQPTLAGYAVRDVVVQDLTVLDGGTFRDTVLFGTLDQTDVEKQPKRVTLRRVTVTAAGAGGHRGVNFNGSDMTLADSTVTGFCEKGRDSQAFLAVNGPGPYTVTGNTLEGSGENIMFGGSDPGIAGMVPGSITIRGNRIRKPATYRGACTVKNLLELKNAKGVLIEGNTLDGNWADGQSGNAIVLTVRNQDGKCPWCIVDDVVLRNNVLTNALDGYAVNILGSDNNFPSQQTRRITIDHNLFTDSPRGLIVGNGVADALVVTNNTFPKVSSVLLSFLATDMTKVVKTPLTFSRNVAKSGSYGITGDGTVTVGQPSLLQFTTVTEWSGNLIETTAERTILYPTGTGNVMLPPGGLSALLDPATYKLLSGLAGY